MPTTAERELPDGASSLIALARVAHKDGDRELEQATLDRLSRDYGMRVSFSCCESVDRDLELAANAAGVRRG